VGITVHGDHLTAEALQLDRDFLAEFARVADADSGVPSEVTRARAAAAAAVWTAT
jgi:hypothetical protein